MIIFKYILFAIFIFIILISTSIYFGFNNYTKNYIQEQNKINLLNIQKFKISSFNNILDNRYVEIKNELETLTQTNKYDYIYINYNKHYITKHSIIIHSNNKIDDSWKLHDIVIDSKYGHLKEINPTTYEIIAPLNHYFDNELIIKSQASNLHEIKNIISYIEFSLPKYKNKTTYESNFIKDYIKSNIPKQEEQELKLYLNKVHNFATITYKINSNIIINSIYKDFINYFKYSVILFLILFITIVIFNYIMMQITINKYLKLLHIYTSDIIKNKYYIFDSNKLVYSNIINISNDINKISKKMANIINELNVNKNLIDLKLSTDTLTTLPNTKMFEQDMKSLFLTKAKAYIIKLKLECLQKFSNEKGALQTDNLILDFKNYTQSCIDTSDSSDNTDFYRIHGGEFILIVKNIEFSNLNILLEQIANINLNLKSKYLLTNKIIHFVSIPFDFYSSTNAILDELNETYINTLDNPKQISFHSQNNSKQNQEIEQLKNIVTSIIKNNAFTLSYKFDTYLFDSNALYMQEVSPNLLNFDGSNIPIGSFISIAQDNDLAIDFDKEVIIKSFKYIEQNLKTSMLAINISIDSMKNDNFITWLESQLLYDYKEIAQKAVFSITTFAAKNNVKEFIHFTNQIKRFNGKILLKRFNYNDLSVEQLEEMNLDYIRVQKDYTSEIDKHKQNILSNIINFCLTNDIILLGDVVSNETDNLVLKSLGFHGTSK